MYDLITIGDITFDIFFKGSTLTRDEGRFALAVGGKYSADEFYTSVGGGGANVAVGVSQLGLTTAVCGRVGENVFKQIVVQKLLSKNVSTDMLIYDQHYINISSILLTDCGERTIIHYVKPTGFLTNNPSILKALSDTSGVYMGNLPGVSLKDRYLTLKKILKKNTVLCSNFGVKDCRRGMDVLADIIGLSTILTLNTHEFSDLVKVPHETIDLSKDCRSLMGKVQPDVLILTDGSKGSHIYSNDTVYFQDAGSAEVIDTTGAGDAYISGFLASYLRDKPLQECARAGAEYARHIISKIGAQ